MSHRLHVALISFRQVHFTSDKWGALDLVRLLASGPITFRAWFDRELGTALGVRVPPSVKVGKLTIQDFVLPDEMKHRQFHRLQSIWSGLR
ncbi:hypothetical protein [Deinococcus ficus]|uniref:Uncharacterized protein n=1 Tax=Deinococcus ficus TaxID=317577 RepID=A0A221T0R3_9DEIO|nr:hypothetical protein [Deinococcus ficus]ASN82451.1 hypothetical protein DFI_14805 [Deinococcus ficus]